jgi:hypothetical protein
MLWLVSWKYANNIAAVLLLYVFIVCSGRSVQMLLLTCFWSAAFLPISAAGCG